MKNIIIITGSELKHDFFRQFLSLSENINVINSFCEISAADPGNKDTQETSDLQGLPVRQQAAHDFFQQMVTNTSDKSNPIFLDANKIDPDLYIRKINELNPDAIINYGFNRLASPIQEAFATRYLNAHVGVGPYHRGCNFQHWKSINQQTESPDDDLLFVDVVIDTGATIQQIHAKFSGKGKFTQPYNQLIVNFLIV